MEEKEHEMGGTCRIHMKFWSDNLKERTLWKIWVQK
jgi:hypothetical protein